MKPAIGIFEPLWAFLWIATISFSCSHRSDDERLHPQEEGILIFSLNPSSNSGVGKRDFDISPKYAKFEMTNDNGEITESSSTLTKYGDTYVSSSISLKSGSYLLNEFLILDDDREVIYAAPKESSDLAYLVDTPLPVSFEVSIEEEVELGVEVISVAGITPEELGYASFTFTPIEVLAIRIRTFMAVRDFYEDPRDEFPYELQVIAKNEDGEETWNHVWQLPGIDIGSQILIPDGHYQYNFTVQKENHLSHSHFILREDLELYEDLQFELIPESSDDFLIFNQEGGVRIILPSNPCILYGRVDLPEGYELIYRSADRNVEDLGSNPVAFKLTECFDASLSLSGGSDLFCGNSVNIYGGGSYAMAEDFCNFEFSQILEAETIEDLLFDSNILFAYTEPDMQCEEYCYGHLFHEWH
jgi:hypothetical protein